MFLQAEIAAFAGLGIVGPDPGGRLLGGRAAPLLSGGGEHRAWGDELSGGAAFRGQSALRTWIYRIVINQARNRQRWWRRRHRSSQVSLDDHLQQFGDVECKTDVLPDRQLASKETSARIWQALDRLPFDQRTALILREVDGLRYDEIAFSLGVAVGTVKSRLTRARQTLRAELLGLRT